MNDKLKNIILSVLFLTVLVGLMLANIITPDKDISISERRKLETAPPYSNKALLDGTLFSDYEKYFLDQFSFRNSFRSLKSIGRFYLMNLKDNNGIYLIGDSVYKMEYPLNELSVRRAAEKFISVSNEFLTNFNIYYSIIPDKNYFVARDNGYLSMDYDKLVSIMNENLPAMKYIDILGALNVEDYYRTDPHWRQDKLLDTANLILNTIDSSFSRTSSFTENTLDNFYGAYYGQSALFVNPDTLTYLTNDVIDNATLYNPITKETCDLYNISAFNSIDPYNLFLKGPEALLQIENPACTNGRELYIFRDSFVSSITPLLLENYSKITLIDLRYISPSLLENFITFTPGNDALFLFSTQILNQSAMLK